MLGASEASKAISELSKRLSMEASKRLPQVALTKYGIYNLAKQVAKWIGVRLTKTTFARGVSKVIPVLGGFISGGITAVPMKRMSYKLKDHLAGLQLAKS